MSQVKYVGFTIDTDLKTAVERYELKIGVKARYAIVPTSYKPRVEGLEFVKAKNVTAIMLTHETADWNQPTKVRGRMKTTTKTITGVTGADIEETTADYIKVKPVRQSAAICPHCQQKIKDWSCLGWYWAWDEREPPYWPKLRAYVFKRDRYQCQDCGEKKKAIQLSCHHIVPKEHGGPDSEDNLMTLCIECHNWLHDYYDALQDKGLYNLGDKMLPLGHK